MDRNVLYPSEVDAVLKANISPYIRINQQSRNNAVELLYTGHRGPSCLSIIERCPYSEVVLYKLYVVVAAGSVLIREVAL